MMKTSVSTTVAALLAMAGSAFALPMAPSIDEAKAVAKAENRAILLDFTGKDWCPGYIYLTNKILTTETFDKAVGDKYVMVELDYPRDPKKIAAMSDEKKQELEAILKAYKVSAFPCIVYLDADGLPYAIISEYTQTPEEYIANIVKRAEDARAARDAAFAKAAGQQGLEKAKTLVAALEALPEACRDKYKAVLADIRANDPENTLGYSRIEEDAARRLAQLDAWEKTLMAHFESQSGARTSEANCRATIAMCEEYLQQNDLIPEVRQKVLSIIVDGYSFMRNIPMIYASAHRAMNEMPDSELAGKYRELIRYYDENLLDKMGVKESAHKAAEPYMKK